MNSDDGQVYTVSVLQFSCFTKYNRMQSKHKQTKCEHSRRTPYITAFSVGITMLNQRIIWKDDIELVTEFPCLLGHPVLVLKYPVIAQLAGLYTNTSLLTFLSKFSKF